MNKEEVYFCVTKVISNELRESISYKEVLGCKGM